MYEYVGSSVLDSVDPFGEKEHTSKKRKSTLNKHQKGQATQQRNQGGDKGDKRRRGNPNKRRGSVRPGLVGKLFVGACVAAAYDKMNDCMDEVDDEMDGCLAGCCDQGCIDNCQTAAQLGITECGIVFTAESLACMTPLSLIQ